jgi:hypothetical protein
MQRGADAPRSASGVLQHARGFQMAIEIGVACPFEPGDDVLVTCGDLGNRVATLARFKSMDGRSAVFTRLSPWRRVDTRSYVRYTTHARATIRRKIGNMHATVVDISLGGLALEVAERPGAARVDVRIGTRYGAPYLPCRVISQRDHGGRVVLHLGFETLDAQSRSYVERLIAELCTAFEPSLLAS